MAHQLFAVYQYREHLWLLSLSTGLDLNHMQPTYRDHVMMVVINQRFRNGHLLVIYQLIHWGQDNGRHFPDDLFKCIFLNENVLISIKISLKFVPKGQIYNIPALV